MWIQTGSDSFVRTGFRYWGNGTDDHLPNWQSNSNGNTTDATTGATLDAYTTKTFTWDATDLDGALLPDGDYKITVEECWDHGSNNVTKSYTFTKDGTESHLTPADDGYFTNVTIDWTPLSTGFEDMENSNTYSVFPNPTSKKNIYRLFIKLCCRQYFCCKQFRTGSL